jgi:lysozyme
MRNPNHNRVISEEGLALVRKWEGFKAEAYRDIAGIWTIGYGTTDPAHAFEGNKISREFAAKLLRQHVSIDEVTCRNLVHVPLSQSQWDAVISLCYNIGTGAFARSTLLRKINNEDFAGAYQEIPRWNRAGGRVVQGLVNRRKEEADLFLRGTVYTGRVTDAEELEQIKPTPASTNVVPDAVPDTGKTTKVVGTVAGTGAALSQASQIEVVRDQLAPLAGLSEYLSLAFIGASLGAIWYMVKRNS